MDNVSALVYCNGDMIPIDERIVFDCPTEPKVITIIEDTSLATLWKISFYANRGCKILINAFLASTKIYR